MLAAAAAVAFAALMVPHAAAAAEQPLGRVQMILADDAQPPVDADPRWQETTLPSYVLAPVAWYRVEFQSVPSDDRGMSMLYLPYLYGGGRVWLNGEPIAAVPETNAHRHVRWERPLLLPLPQSLLRAHGNVLHLRPVAAHQPGGNGLSLLTIGNQDELQSRFEWRLFFVRTVPVVTVVVGTVVALFVIFIWLRRRQEVLYGLFGCAVLLWALRTLTFVFDSLPASVWPLWRLLFHASTGGFIVVMTLFALALAGWYRHRIALGLFAYWLLGPTIYLFAGPQAEVLVGRWWVAGLIPIGLSMIVITGVAAWRQRSLETVVIALAVALAVLAGVHDYLVAWRAPVIEALLPRWTESRIFLLHHGANLLLLVMGALLTLRFLRSLLSAEEAKRTLEARVATREREISASYGRIAVLQREQATTEERQRIMQDLHDGLGSQLFTSLLRAERGALDSTSIAEMLRRAIDEMRIAIEALASEESDFRTAFGNFRFRWEQRLRDAGLASNWNLEVPDRILAVPPHDALQVLRIAQEALTNVLRHARASRVRVALRVAGGGLELEIEDDGTSAETSPGSGGRGVANMRARAAKLGGELVFERSAHGTRVALRMPLAPAEGFSAAADIGVAERAGSAPEAASSAGPGPRRPAGESGPVGGVPVSA